jgi:hypothetical protein
MAVSACYQRGSMAVIKEPSVYRPLPLLEEENERLQLWLHCQDTGFFYVQLICIINEFTELLRELGSRRRETRGVLGRKRTPSTKATEHRGTSDRPSGRESTRMSRESLADTWARTHTHTHRKAPLELCKHELWVAWGEIKNQGAWTKFQWAGTKLGTAAGMPGQPLIEAKLRANDDRALENSQAPGKIAGLPAGPGRKGQSQSIPVSKDGLTSARIWTHGSSVPLSSAHRAQLLCAHSPTGLLAVGQLEICLLAAYWYLSQAHRER